MEKNTPQQYAGITEESRFIMNLCMADLHAAVDKLSRIANAAAQLKSETGLNHDDFESYCGAEFSVPANLLIALLEYHEELRSQQSVNNAK